MITETDIAIDAEKFEVLDKISEGEEASTYGVVSSEARRAALMFVVQQAVTVESCR